MATDPAFKSVQRNKSGFYIWRIENMKVVPVPKEKYGAFYVGDSYIVLSMSEQGQIRGVNVKIKEAKGAMEMHIHFWLGGETTADEAGVAAYKTVELDDFLGGTPVQHRELQNTESKLFMSYFKEKGGVRYCSGGVKSGFNHVEDIFKERLLHVKGKHHVRVSEVAREWSSMNHGDVYILDTGVVMFVWIGKEASRTERIKGLEHSRKLRDERKKVSIYAVEDGQEDQMTSDEKAVFEKYLPLSQKGNVKSKEEGGSDEVVERKGASEIKLFVCSEESGTLKVSEVKSGPLSKKDLDSSEAYIIDNGSQGIWAWTGKNSSKRERAEAMRNALGFLKKKNLDKETNVTKIVEGGEPADFKCLFRDWPQPPVTGKVYCRNRIAKTIQTKFDASTLHSNQQMAAETQMFDDGSGRAEIWRVKDFDLEPIQSKYMGQFFAGDCYVIHYMYQAGGRDNHIIYYWQGLKSTADEKGTSALKAVELDDKLGGSAVQVRVVQGKEPPHFMSMFEGKMIIFSGGHAGWGGPGNNNAEGPGDNYMLQVRGTNKLNTKAVQVEMDATSLNTNDVFCIFTKTAVFIWCGKGSTGDEREMAKTVCKRSPREPIMVFEGQEKDNFWSAIGGKKEYFNTERFQDIDVNYPARLFQLSNSSGKIVVDEIIDFSQQDLVTDDVMILDIGEMIFVWIGNDANKQEKEAAEQCAIDYIKTDPAGRDEDTVITRIKQGYEPPTFTGFFPTWDRDIWSKGKTYEELKEELGSTNEPISIVKQNAENGSFDFQDVAKYPLAQLIVPTEELPSGVDPSCREIHLSNDDFDNVFKMKYTEFVQKPLWKQKEMKKKAGLF